MTEIEVFYQIGLQIVLLLLTLTDTATLGSLETFFQQDPKNYFGIVFSPETILSAVESKNSNSKGFFGFKAKISAFLWGLVASVRRVLGIVARAWV